MKKIHTLIIFLCLDLICIRGNFAQTSSSDFIHLSSITQDLHSPVRMALDNLDNVYVTDPYSNSIKKYDTSGNLVETIVPGVTPSSVAIGDENEIFVGDGSSGKIYRIGNNQQAKEIYSGEISPVDMEASPDKMLYIVDATNKRVLVIDFYGNFVRYIGSGVLLSPTGIAYDSKNSRIIVSEHGGTGTGFNLHSEIRIFSLTGTLVTTFGGYGNGDGKFYRTQGMTVGRCGNIYVTDPFQGNVSVFNSNGAFITKFGIYGSLPGQLNVPMDVVFNSKERVMISTVNNGALEMYSITDVLPSSNILTRSAYICPGESAKIVISFTGTAPWNYTYVRDGANPVNVTGNYDNPDTLTVSVPGIYTVNALSDAQFTGTCFTGAATVISNPLPTAAITTGNLAICQGDTANIQVTLTGLPLWSLTYTVDNLNPTTITDITRSPYIIHATNAGTYNIAALTGGKCQGTSFSGSSTVTIRPLPVIAASSNSPLCTGSSVDLNASGGISFLWTGPNGFTSTSQSPSIPNSSIADAGNYKVVVSDYDGCKNSTTVIVMIDSLRQVGLSITASDNNICPNNNIMFTAVAVNPGTEPSYQWKVNGINAGDDNEIFSYAPANNDTVTCTMTSNLSCAINNPATSNAVIITVNNFLNSDFLADNLIPLRNEPVNLTDLTVGGATSWVWSFNRPGVVYLNGTDSLSQNPQVLFTQGGPYTVTLTTGNLTCTDSEIKSAYLWAGAPGLWAGDASPDWNTVVNWDNWLVPDNTIDIVIPPSANFWPVFDGDLIFGMHCRSLFLIGTTSKMTINGDLIIP